jgi:hypothetical protein
MQGKPWLALSLFATALAMGCARSFESRLRSVDPATAAARFPVVSSQSERMAEILTAIDVPAIEDRDASAPLILRLLTRPDSPKYLVHQIEGVGDSASAYMKVEGSHSGTWPVSRAAWLGLQRVLDEEKVWDADWQSVVSVDGVVYGFEIRQGNQHRVLWLINPDVSERNDGFMRVILAIEAAMGIVRVS